MRKENVKTAVKTVNIKLEIPLEIISMQQKLSVAEGIIASALKIISAEKILHRDNVEDLQFIIEDFISSLSDNNYYDINFIILDGDEQ